MRIITWNMGYWLHRTHHAAAWEFLRQILRPDIALLQEVNPPTLAGDESLVFQQVHGGWGTALYARGIVLRAVGLSVEYPGRVAGAVATLAAGSELFLASIHAPIIRNRVFPHLSRIVEQIDAATRGRPAILGGDLNSARLAEAVWPGYGHGPFFDHMDRSRFVNCCWRIHGRELQTVFKPNAKHPFQDDHLFVTDDLAPGLVACDVADNSTTRTVSDHIPLVVELEPGKTSTLKSAA